MSKVRVTIPRLNLIENGGWHFGWLGGYYRILKKFKSFAHSDLNSAYGNIDRIKERVDKNMVFFHDGDSSFTIIDVQYPDLPKYVVENKNDFALLIKTTDYDVEQLKEIVMKSDECISNLTEDVISVEGMTGVKIKHLLNNLGSISKHYLEVGCWKGATSTAAIFKNNNLVSATLVDNFSEFDSDGIVQSILEKNISSFKNESTLVGLLKKDCFSVKGMDNIDLYLYDGNHSYESQKKAITHFASYMAKKFILLVDDFLFPHVQQGTFDGIKESNLNVLVSFTLGLGKESDSTGYWNGIYVALIERP